MTWSTSNSRSSGPLSAKDGTVKDTYELKTSATIKTIYSLTVSSDGKKIAYTDSGLNYIGEDKIHVYDTETHKDSSCLYDFYYVWKISFLDNDHICLMMSNDVFSSSMDYNNFSYLAEGFVTFSCYDTNLNKKWDNELTYSNVMINFGMMTIPSRNSVTCYAGNAASILDIATGTVTNHYLTGSSIISEV